MVRLLTFNFFASSVWFTEDGVLSTLSASKGAFSIISDFSLTVAQLWDFQIEVEL